jgi:hypothetical protein
LQRREDEVNDGASNDEEAPEASARPPAFTLLLRIWTEQDGAEPLVRGTLSDLSGKPLGAFGSFETLRALLARLLSQPRP